MDTRYSCAPRALRTLLLSVLTVLLAAPVSGQGRIGPSLQDALAEAASSAHLEVVVTYAQEEPLTAAQVDALGALGVTGFSFQSLPIAGALATPAQVSAIAGLDGVSSVWLNERLDYFNADARQLTGVDRLRTDSRLRNQMGLPFSGKGVGVVVNDSGVDGAHPDLKYGRNLVQNVLGTTNLHAYEGMLPITYLEDQISTDQNSGHGTHCAGTIGGTGAQSGGLHAGVAPGADLVGYGSGGVLFILDAVGGLDYALTNQFQYGIRVVSNSWGSSGEFNPFHPVNEASYRLYQRGITVVFAAGNSGPGEDTHNPYAQAPWVLSVGAGEKDGTLVDFSSRGLDGESGTFRTYDGQTWTYHNEPTIVAPGVDIISTCAAGSPLCALGIQDNTFYTQMSGTSMATPHVAGIVALMLEANPRLSPAEVKATLQRTATNMPGMDDWEVGAGYVNAYAAVVDALGLRDDFGSTLNDGRAFNANVEIDIERFPVSIDYNPQPALSADGNTYEFTVPNGLSLISVRIDADGIVGRTGNTIYPVFIAPDGTEHLSGTTLLFPLEFNRIQTVGSPVPGEWTLEIRGIQSGTGENVVSVPEQVKGTLSFHVVNGLFGADDIAGHPAAGAIEAAVDARLLDGYPDGTFRPDADLRRGEIAQYLVMGSGVRQHRPLDGSPLFSDVPDALAPFAEAVGATGPALRDRAQRFDPVVRSENGAFRPDGSVTRAELAYSLVQTLAGQGLAEDLNAQFAAGADVSVRFRDEVVALDDQDEIPAELKGYVQIALELGVLNAFFSLEQGPYDLEPTIRASFLPDDEVSRGQFAVSTFATHQHYLAGVSYAAGSAGDTESTLDGDLSALRAAPELELEANAPNPFGASTRIAFSLAEAGPARLAVYDLLGREVAVLVDDSGLTTGRHEVDFEAGTLASGTYVYRLTAGDQSLVRRMTVVR